MSQKVDFDGCYLISIVRILLNYIWLGGAALMGIFLWKASK